MTKHPETFSAQIPFAGFYGSVHDAIIDNAENGMFTDSGGDENNPRYQPVFQRYLDNQNHSQVFLEYAKTYTAAFAELAGISLEFEKMSSPREYNFKTDRIFAKITRNDLAKMLKKVRGKLLDSTITGMFTSCPGFLSFYPNHISDWPRINEWDHNHCYAVLKAYVEIIKQEEGVKHLEEYIVYEKIGTDKIDEWLYDAASDKAKRAINIASYLRQREERNYAARCLVAAS